MPTAEKVAAVERMTKQLSEAKSVYLTEFSGLNVEQITELRRAFSGVQVEYKVVKNTLAKLSAKEAGCEDIVEHLNGPIAIAFGMEDPVAPAKVIKEFSKKNEKLKLKACLFEGVLFGDDKLDQIAGLPTRDEVLAQVCGVLNAPIANLAFALNGVISKFVYAVNAVKEQKEKQVS